jgi:hypothetical protein
MLNRTSRNCEVTYQRFIESEPADEITQSTAVCRHEVYGPRREDATEDQLKLCFR